MTYTPLPHTCPHLPEAELRCPHAGFVYLFHRPGRQGVLLFGQGSALLHQLFALREAGHGCIVLRLVDDLKSVGIIVGHDGVEWHLGDDVDAAVHDADRVKLERNGVGELGCLAGEEVGECRTVVTTVGLGPDGEFVGFGLVGRESRAAYHLA